MTCEGVRLVDILIVCLVVTIIEDLLHFHTSAYAG